VIDSAGVVYGLSNNHVWAGSNIGDPAVDVAVVGDPIVQPGLGDHIAPCDLDPLDIIGTLADFQPLSPIDLNVMDCSLMLTDPTLLAASTPDDGYGFPSSELMSSPYIGLEVQKSGRTTLFTRGRVTALNISAPVNYGFLAQFESSIEIRNDTEFFGGPGDSGSLIVTFPDRRPVAILFAGSATRTLGNPILPILERFNVIIDDGSLTPAPVIFPTSGRMGIATGPVVPPPVTLP
jgi:hypothetical protein